MCFAPLSSLWRLSTETRQESCFLLDSASSRPGRKDWGGREVLQEWKASDPEQTRLVNIFCISLYISVCVCIWFVFFFLFGRVTSRRLWGTMCLLNLIKYPIRINLLDTQTSATSFRSRDLSEIQASEKETTWWTGTPTAPWKLSVLDLTAFKTSSMTSWKKTCCSLANLAANLEMSPPIPWPCTSLQNQTESGELEEKHSTWQLAQPKE